MPVAAGAGQKIGEIAVLGLPDFQRGAAQADMREMQGGGMADCSRLFSAAIWASITARAAVTASSSGKLSRVIVKPVKPCRIANKNTVPDSRIGNPSGQRVQNRPVIRHLLLRDRRVRPVASPDKLVRVCRD